MREEKAKYSIQSTFVIHGLGLVLGGEILEGTIHIGDIIEFDFESESLEKRILGVEGIRDVSQKLKMGLLIVYWFSVNRTLWLKNKVVENIGQAVAWRTESGARRALSA